MQVEREALVTDNHRLVRRVARQVEAWLATPAPLDDLVEYGMVGLVEAAERYDPSRGVPFSSFAWPRIRGSVIEGLRTMRNLSRGELRRMRAEQAAQAILAEAASNELPPGASIEEEFDITANLVADVAVTYVASNPDPDPEELPDRRPGPEHQVADQELSHALDAALRRLPEREREILRMHYFGEMNLAEAGRELGMSRSWALRLHNRAIGLLREALAGSA